MHKQILLVLRHASRWSNYRGVGVTHEMILEIFTLYLDVIVRLSLQWRLFPPPGCLLAPSTFSTPTPNTRSLSRPASRGKSLLMTINEKISPHENIFEV